MNIGTVAKQSGLPAKTIRYYEEIGLIAPDRGENGYRCYDAADLHRLVFLRRARGLGFSIQDCRALLSLYENKRRASADVKALTLTRIADIEEKLAELESLRTTLMNLAEACSGDARPDCPILEDLAGNPAAGGSRGMIKPIGIAAALLALAGVVGVGWHLMRPMHVVAAIDPSDAEIVARGQSVYAEACASCHGAALEGQTANWRQRLPDGRWPAPPHDASGHTWHHPAWMLFEITKFGRMRGAGPPRASNMPAFSGTLSDEEIWAVLSYIKSTWPEQIQDRHTRITEHMRRRR